MHNSDTVYAKLANWQIADDMTVYSSDGEKVGTLRNYNPQAGYLDIRRGWLFHRDLFLPADCVAYIEGGDIVLRLEKAALEDPAFHAPPAREDSPCAGGESRRVRPLPALEHEIARVRALLGRHHRPHRAD